MTTQPEEPKHILVDPNDPAAIKIAHDLVKGMLDRYGESQTIGILMNGLSELMIAVLHMPSPDAETNIQSIRRLMNALVDTVREHETCAWAVSDTTAPKGLVH